MLLLLPIKDFSAPAKQASYFCLYGPSRRLKSIVWKLKEKSVEGSLSPSFSPHPRLLSQQPALFSFSLILSHSPQPSLPLAIYGFFPCSIVGLVSVSCVMVDNAA